MLIGDKHYTSIWLDPEDNSRVMVIDQTRLPFELLEVALVSVEDVFGAIQNMVVRGAPLIGVTAAFGIYLAAREATNLSRAEHHLKNAAKYLCSSRPTAVNLEWATNRMLNRLSAIKSPTEIVSTALDEALKIWSEERESTRMIGVNGLPLIKEISKKKGGATVNILTHCNAGWLACVDYGTATSPIYMAHDAGVDLHVWVDETRPRNQGARLTAYELAEHGVPHTLITDNAGGHLMQKGLVDMVITGSDRTSRNGDVANKIGTYLKALAAHDNNIPFYVALPVSTIDTSIENGLTDIIVEERDGTEVSVVEGLYKGEIVGVNICSEKTRVSNFGFDITPAKYITALITERGICSALEEEIVNLLKE
jgi:methylthioribose-1-phosphate isomerase